MKDKNHKFRVIACCQGNPKYYDYDSLFKALIKYAKVYHKWNKYGTFRFDLKQVFKGEGGAE